MNTETHKLIIVKMTVSSLIMVYENRKDKELPRFRVEKPFDDKTLLLKEYIVAKTRQQKER